MAKKSRSKNKRKTSRTPAKPDRGSSGLIPPNQMATETSPQFAAAGSVNVPYAQDFRDNFAGGTNGSQYSYNSQAPLTNRNLQTLLEQSSREGSRSRPVALDMDRFTRDQHEHSMQADIDTYSNKSQRSNKLLLEFGELNPSLDHLSDLTSLDDVCFPDYYDHRLDDEGSDRPFIWPDLQVLEDYIVEEVEDLQCEMKEEAENFLAVNFRVPVARHVGKGNNPPSLHDMGEAPPISEGTPLLHLIRVDETSLMHLGSSALRVRPKHILPWQKSEEQVTKVLNNPNQRKSEQLCRYTYFREDMDGTIHSPTLSGLVHPDLEQLPREQIQTSLHDMFSQFPGNKSGFASATSETQSVDALNTGKKQVPTVNVVSPSAATLSHSQPQGQKANSPKPLSPLASALNSMSSNHHHKSPFWLDILDPTEEEMKVISKTFGLHPLTTEDIFLGEAREKVELFKQYYFICFTSFDVVYERRKQRAMENEKKNSKILEYDRVRDDGGDLKISFFRRIFGKLPEESSRISSKKSMGLSSISHNKKVRSGELCPLNMYMIIFKHGVLTFHFNATPHPINVRRRIRMLKDHLTVSTDWICYGLIDDITDSFAPLIDSIEQEVYLIEDQIMKLNSGDETDLDDDDDDQSSTGLFDERRMKHNISSGNADNVFYRRQRSKSVVEASSEQKLTWRLSYRSAKYDDHDSRRSSKLKSHSSLSTSSSRSTLSAIVAWKRKGDMLRRIGECRKRVMSVMRLLGTKADVIKGFSKRFSENEALVNLPLDSRSFPVRLSLRNEILMYLGDIQDHIVTMVQSLNHYEKLLARSHSNYLALLNIDMTRINNDTNDILGKVTILGTILLPINVVTGLWGMNCIVPGQDHPGLMWFYGILLGITLFSIISYIYARRVTGL